MRINHLTEPKVPRGLVSRRRSLRGAADVAVLGGKLAVAIGLVLVVLARGGDSVGNRGLARANAKIEQERMELGMDEDMKMPKISSREDFERMQERRRQQAEKRKANEKRLEDVRKDAREAAISNTKLAYFREWLFVIGSIVLAMGLLHVGFNGTGPERIICLIMLAIITFSVYVGGVPWISSFQPPQSVTRTIMMR